MFDSNTLLSQAFKIFLGNPSVITVVIGFTLVVGVLLIVERIADDYF